MVSLEQWGVHAGAAGDYLLRDKQTSLGADDFFRAATDLLQQLREVVTCRIVPELVMYAGMWHPSGFMAYRLGAHRDFGSLRLHVWPVMLRKRVIKGRGDMGEIYDGDIH